MRKQRSDDHGEIRQYQQATGEELPSLPFAGVQLSKRRQAGNDENDMPDGGNEHHERVRSLQAAGTEHSQKLARFSLYQMRAEPLELFQATPMVKPAPKPHAQSRRARRITTT